MIFRMVRRLAILRCRSFSKDSLSACCIRWHSRYISLEID